MNFWWSNAFWSRTRPLPHQFQLINHSLSLYHSMLIKASDSASLNKLQTEQPMDINLAQCSSTWQQNTAVLFKFRSSSGSLNCCIMNLFRRCGQTCQHVPLETSAHIEGHNRSGQRMNRFAVPQTEFSETSDQAH